MLGMGDVEIDPLEQAGMDELMEEPVDGGAGFEIRSCEIPKDGHEGLSGSRAAALSSRRIRQEVGHCT
jgi:hypothetical protein